MAMVQKMLSSLAQKVGLSAGADDEIDLKKGNRSGVSVAWFFVAAIGASVTLRVLDKCLFSEDKLLDDETTHNALCAFAAFAAGVVISELSGLGLAGLAQGPGAKAVETDCGPRAAPCRAAGAPAVQQPLSEVDSALVSEILDASHKGCFAVAEKHLQELVQSLGAPRDFDDELPNAPASAGMRPERAVHSLVEVCIHAGDAQRASAWIEALHKCGMRCAPRTLRWVLDELSNGASTKEAEQLFSKMLAAGAQMDDLCYQLLFERLADGDAAIEAYLMRLAQRGASERVTGYVALIRMAAAAGDRDRAERWLKHCVENARAPRTAAARAQAAPSADASWPSEATENWLRQVLEAGSEPHEVDYGSVIDAWAGPCEAAGARRLIELMRA